VDRLDATEPAILGLKHDGSARAPQHILACVISSWAIKSSDRTERRVDRED